MNPRYRSTMEDACAVVDGFGGDAGTGYFGIYDGHGGRNVAEFVRLHLHVNVEKELRGKGDRSLEECLKAAFLATDMECSMTGEQASGSTAAVCIIRRQGAKRYVYTANAGDARAVLCHAGMAVRLSKVRRRRAGRRARAGTRQAPQHSPPPLPSPPPLAQDHKATDAVEKARIEAAGGFVARKRVMGVLAVARAFGDFVLKKFVTAEPYTSTTKLDAMVRVKGRAQGRSTRSHSHMRVFPSPPAQSQFVIIACDGVWDVLEDQEAVDMVREHTGGGAGATAPPHSKAKTAAQVLVDAALAKGSSDNITALVVFL